MPHDGKPQDISLVKGFHAAFFYNNADTGGAVSTYPLLATLSVSHQLPVKQTTADRGHGHKKTGRLISCRPGKLTIYIIAGRQPASLTVSNIRQPDLVPFELDTALRPEMAPVQIWR